MGRSRVVAHHIDDRQLAGMAPDRANVLNVGSQLTCVSKPRSPPAFHIQMGCAIIPGSPKQRCRDAARDQRHAAAAAAIAAGGAVAPALTGDQQRAECNLGVALA
jgi:hypothetical protein